MVLYYFSNESRMRKLVIAFFSNKKHTKSNIVSLKKLDAVDGTTITIKRSTIDFATDFINSKGNNLLII